MTKEETGAEDREADLSQKSENRVGRGHDLSVSDEEMAAASDAFDEYDIGCGQNHHWEFAPNMWRAALTAFLEVRARGQDDLSTHDHNPDACPECENIDEAAFQRGREWERDEVGLVGSSRHGPIHVGWDRVIQALSASVDEAIAEAVRGLMDMDEGTAPCPDCGDGRLYATGAKSWGDCPTCKGTRRIANVTVTDAEVEAAIFALPLDVGNRVSDEAIRVALLAAKHAVPGPGEWWAEQEQKDGDE